MLQAYLTRAQTIRMVSTTRHDLSGAVGCRLDFAGLSFGFSGDTRACWPLVRACEGGVDLLIHECFPPTAAQAAASGLSIVVVSVDDLHFWGCADSGKFIPVFDCVVFCI
jgi:hypothetical protein